MDMEIDEGPPPPPPPPPPAAGGGQLFLVWMEGVSVGEGFSFNREYVLPCQAQFGAAFLEEL